MALFEETLSKRAALRIVGDLERLARYYRWPVPRPTLAQLQARKRLMTIVGRLRTVVRDIEAIPAPLRGEFEPLYSLADVMTLRAVEGAIGPTSEWDLLQAVRQAAEAVMRYAPAAPKRRPKPGQPINRDRDAFVLTVALVLWKHGVALNVTRGGVFANTLDIVSKGVFTMPSVENIVPLMSRVVMPIRQSPKKRLDTICRNPDFPILWRRGEY
jgi:hypothetical protein